MAKIAGERVTPFLSNLIGADGITAGTPSADVFTPNKQYRDMEKRFHLPDALMGGTHAMRELGVQYMPPYPSEETSRYTRRLRSAVLFEAFRKAVQNLSSRPFRKEIFIEEEADEFWQTMTQNVDREGTTITSFARELMQDLLVFGKCHILIDHPDSQSLSEALGRSLTLADEREYALRPYLSRVSPKSVIGWRSQNLSGSEVLTELRIRETAYDYVGDFEQEEVSRVHLWTPSSVATYKKVIDQTSDEEIAVLESQRENTLGMIPLVTIYANRIGFLESDPPLEALAHLNQKHWWMQADQDNIETVARVPMLFFRGFNAEDLAAMEVGPYKIFGNRSPESDIKVVETSGKAVEVGAAAIKRLEQQMERMSLEPLIRKAGVITATEVAVDENRNMSHMEAYVTLLERGLSEALGIVGQWIKREDVPVINIDKDSSHVDTSDRALEEMRLDYTMGVIDRRTYLEHRKQRGLYSEDMELDEVIEASDSEVADDLLEEDGDERADS